MSGRTDYEEQGEDPGLDTVKVFFIPSLKNCMDAVMVKVFFSSNLKRFVGMQSRCFLYFQKIIMNTDKVLVEEKKASVTKVSELSKNLNRFSSLGSQ